MWNKSTPDVLRNIEHLKRASPEVVYQWFQSQPRPEFFKSYRPEQYEGLENELLKRNDELIDLSLAKWAKESETRKSIFYKYFSKKGSKSTLARKGYFEDVILINLLSNENLSYHYSDHRFVDFCEDDFIIELFNDSCDLNCFDAVHYNTALAIKSLIFLSSKSGVYSSLSDDRWIGAVARLAANEAIGKIEDFKYNLDALERQRVIQAILNICLISPKTEDSLDACVRLLENFQNWFAISELDDLLVEAVDIWSDEKLPNDPNLVSFDIGSDWDGMRANERLQFHLWRVAGRVGFDANDPRKHVRLGAYAINGVSEYDIKYNLKAEDVTSYSKRDGAAFMYANSYNHSIWSPASIHSQFRKNVLGIKFDSGVTYPRNPSVVHEIRKRTSEIDEFPDSSRDYMSIYDEKEIDAHKNIIEYTNYRFNYLESLFRKGLIGLIISYLILAIIVLII